MPENSDVPEPRLRDSSASNERVVVKVLKEVTVYKSNFTPDEHDLIIDLYREMLPSRRDKKFLISELQFWSSVANPRLTQSARSVAGRHLCEFEASRNRIRMARPFVSRLWDGFLINDRSGSWSLDMRQVPTPNGLMGYCRVLFPLETQDSVVSDFAKRLCDTVTFTSGHGGLTFTYDPEFKTSAFDEIYSISRRYAGIDIEDLKVTLPSMLHQLKPACWLNMIGRSETIDAQMWRSVNEIESASVSDLRFGKLIQLGSKPSVLDRNRGEASPVSHKEYDRITSSWRLSDFGTFSGLRFTEDAVATNQWLTRFADEG